MPDLSRKLVTELVATAEAVADAARAATLPYFRAEGLDAESKARHFDPVTAADRAAEVAMRAVLAERRPSDGILGEEFAAIAGSSGLTWVIDPIDGTRGFMSGTPTWGVLVAVSDVDGPRYGLIDQPYIQERFRGGFGRSEYEGPQGRRTLRSRAPRPLEEAILFTTFPEIGTEAERHAFGAVAARARLVRFGMDCYAYAMVAAGQIDLVIEAGLQPYDIHAPMAVVEAAGGVVTDWRGNSPKDGGRVLAAANAGIHAEVLALLSEAGG